jgi:ribonuclease HI
MIVEVAFDGGCRNNPNGQASSAAIVRDLEGRTLRHVGSAIGIASNNVAEWTGLFLGLQAARDLGATEVRVFGDSKLVVEQFKGNYSVKDETLRAIAMEVSQIARTFASVTIEHVPREQNRAADAICTAVLNDAYVPDADLSAIEDGGDVEVAFVVQVRMDRKAATAALASGKTVKELRKQLAAQMERKLMLTGVVGEIAVSTSRIKG